MSSLARIQGILIGTFSVLIFFLLNWSIQKFVTGYDPMSLFLGAIVIAAWAGGPVAGILATVLGALTEILLIGTSTSFWPLHGVDTIRLVVDCALGVFISLMFGRFHSWQRRLSESESRLSGSLKREREDRLSTQAVVKQLRKSQTLVEAERDVCEKEIRVKALILAQMNQDLRTPLVSIIGFAELMKNPSITDENRRRYLGIIERSGRSLKNMINETQDTSKFEAGRLEPESV